MAPGHFQCHFSKRLRRPGTKGIYGFVQSSTPANAFIFWNHPGWDRQQPDTTLWWNEHTRLYEEGYMQGIEVANGKNTPEAQRWCMEKETDHDRHIGYPSTHPDRYRFCTGPTPYDDLRICPGNVRLKESVKLYYIAGLQYIWMRKLSPKNNG